MIINRTTRLLWRRKYRRGRRQVEDLGEQAEENLERHLLRRLGRLYEVRRFVLSWLGLLILLSGIVVIQTRALNTYYQELQPIPGGIYTEGIIGTFTNASPLYATGSVDNTVTQLLFAGLMKYDAQGKLVPDLAEKMVVDDTGKKYTMTLRQDVFWHDGQRLTAGDVLFTYQLIQNPDAKSPLFNSWKGIKIESLDPRTIVFTLPNPLTSFPHSLTNGIIPKHILETVPIPQLRSARFNTSEPIGSGPFKWEAVELRGSTPEDREERIGLIPNERYHAGKPKIQSYIVRTFRSEERMLKSFGENEISAMVGLSSLPNKLKTDASVKVHSIPVTGAVMVFFRSSHEQLKDVKVRQALVRAVDTTKLVKGLDYPAIAVDGPFLKSHVGYDPKRTQLEHDVATANQLLDEAGWVRGEDGIRFKDGNPLSFSLHGQNTGEFLYIMNFLQKSWREVGAQVNVDQPSADDFQSRVTFHNYDALLYGVSLGADPDVFAYWHSSQADVRSANRLNLSEYSSQAADQALEGGRTRTDPQLRAVKYTPFLDAWRNDAPALALYQPRFLYVVRGGLHNFEPKMIHLPSDRLSDVQYWMVRQARGVKD